MTATDRPWTKASKDLQFQIMKLPSSEAPSPPWTYRKELRYTVVHGQCRQVGDGNWLRVRQVRLLLPTLKAQTSSPWALAQAVLAARR